LKIQLAPTTYANSRSPSSAFGKHQEFGIGGLFNFWLNLVAAHQDSYMYTSTTQPIIFLAIFVDDGLIKFISQIYKDPIL
jgi:hypothetical protein